jgi:hypothetical protein
MANHGFRKFFETNTFKAGMDFNLYPSSTWAEEQLTRGGGI